jgi:hypothetical protein
MPLRTALLMAVLIACAAPAAEKPAVRAARAGDLPGLWQMVALTKYAEVDAADSLFAPYQLFYFDPSGRMKYMTSPKPFRDTQRSMFNAAPPVTRFTLDRRGQLQLTNPGWDAPRSYLCRFVTRDAPGDGPVPLRAGDLLLTGVDDAGKPAWSKLLRKTTP